MNLSPSQQPRLPIDRVVAIVDDDREVRQSTAHLLRHAGYAVREFPNGDAFLSSPARHEVSGVILDLRMPGKDGLQVCAKCPAALRCRSSCAPARRRSPRPSWR